MDCPTCHTGDVILHFDTPNDRCRFECGGPVAGTPCGYAGDWMPTAMGETLVTVSCERLRGTVLVLQDMAAARDAEYVEAA